MKKLLLLLLVLSFSSFANYPTIQSGGGGIGEWEVSAAYTADTIVFDGTDFYKALVDHTSGTTNIADEVLAGTMIKMVDPNDYLVGLTSNVQAQFDAAVARISTNETDIATNQTNITTNTSNIGTNQTSIAANASSISTNSSNIATNLGNINTNTSDISDNAADIVTNTANVTAITSSIGAANGLATLDANGKIPLTQFSTDLLIYQGGWDGTANSPALDNTDTNVENFWYRVNVAGSIDFGAGPIAFEVNDRVVNNGTVWEKWDSSDAVTSVNTQTGDVVLDNLDIGLGNVLDVEQLVVTASDWETNYVEKLEPVVDDIVLIEDSEDSFNRKKVKLQNLLGGGAGDVAAFIVEDFELTSPTNLQTGQDPANYFVAGTFGGTLELEETAPLAASKSLKYTAGAASAGDWINLGSHVLKEREILQGKVVYKVLIDASNFAINFDLVLFDETNSMVLEAQTILPNTPLKEYLFVYDTDTLIRNINLGIHLNNGAIDTETILIDNYIGTTDLFVNVQLDANNSFGASINSAGTILETFPTNLPLTCATTSSGYNCDITFLNLTEVPVCVATSTNTGSDRTVYFNYTGSTVTNLAFFARNSGGSGSISNISFDCNKGDQDNKSSSQFAALPSESNMFDWIVGEPLELTASPTPPTKATAPIYDVSRYRRVGDSLDFQIEYTHDSNIGANNGSGLYGFKIPVTGLNIDLTKVLSDTSTTNTNFGTVVGTYTSEVNGTTNIGLVYVYDATHVYLSDYVGQKVDNANENIGAAAITYHINASVPIVGWTSENFFFSLIPPVPVVFLKDVKPQGVNGGDAVANTYVTRDLNVVEGDTSLASISSNQFTILKKGTYIIKAKAQQFGVDKTRLKIFSVTDSVDVLFGNNSNEAGTGTLSDGPSFLEGQITIESPKTFELRHYTQLTRATSGLGQAMNIAGESEYYSEIKITKIK